MQTYSKKTKLNNLFLLTVNIGPILLLLVIIINLEYMQVAGFANFIKTVFYVVLFYYAFKFLLRLLTPLLLKKLAEKIGNNMQNKQNTESNQDVKIGETVIDKNTVKSSKPLKDVGEYIDFEEL